MSITGDPLGLYFHVPFCLKKCPYCHFYSIKYDESRLNSYIDGILRHLLLEKEILNRHPIDTIYFGGGTPSLLGAQNLLFIINHIRKYSTILPNCEITLEINPCINKKQIEMFKKAGINRISIGAQSFDDESLKILGRTHTAVDTKKTIEACYHQGLENISIDLMYDIPYQKEKDFEKTCLELEKLPITHLSLYNLQIEEPSYYHAKKELFAPFMPKEQESLNLLKRAFFSIKNKGLIQYEISAFCKKGFHSKHNSKYWTGKPFLGFGPSAFSYYSQKRFQTAENLSLYLKSLERKNPYPFTEKLSYPDNLKELLVIGLRILNGVNIDEFESKWGILPKSVKEKLFSLQNEHLLIYKHPFWKLTEKGLLFYDTVAEELI